MSSLLIWYVAFTNTHTHTRKDEPDTVRVSPVPGEWNKYCTQPTKRPEKYIPCLLSYTIGGKIRIHLQPFA